MSRGGSAKALIQAAGQLVAVTSLLGQAVPLPLVAPTMGLVGPHVSATLDGGYGCPNLGCSALFGLSVGYTNRPWHVGAAVASVNPATQ